MKKKLALLFPGQGTQYLNMGKDFFENFTVAKEVFEAADDILKFKLSDIIFGDDEKVLLKTVNSQLAIFVTSYAIFKTILKNFDMKKNVFATAGLSLGEYNALLAAKKIDFQNSLPFVQKRASYMQKACEKTKGKMAAIIGLDFSKIENVINKEFKDEVWVANYNTANQTVISGKSDAIEKAIEKLKLNGARKAVILNVSGAFHSGLMQHAHDMLENHINEVNVYDSDINIIMNVTGNFENDTKQIKRNMINQVTNSVRWIQSVELLNNNGIDLYIEIGPGRTLTMMNKSNSNIPTINIGKINDLEKLNNF